MKEYSVTATGITVANHAPLSLVALMPPAGGMIEILRMWISQNANANSAQQWVQWAMVSTPFQTVTSATPQKTKSGRCIRHRRGNNHRSRQMRYKREQ